jgi:hypothetical protein
MNSLHHLVYGDLSLFWRIYDGLKTLVPDTEPVADPYAELKAAQKAGETIQVKWDGSDCWCDLIPDWSLSVDRYRIKPEVHPRQAEINKVRAAYESGKTIQWRALKCGDGWIDAGKNWTQDDWDAVLEFNQPVRVKPEPRLRPWKTEEVPVGALLHWNNSVEHTYLIVSHYADEGKVRVFKRDGIKTYDYRTLANYCSYSTDGGKTWSKCGVTE